MNYLHLFEFILADAAIGAHPIIGQVLERRPGIYPAFRISLLGIVYVTANSALPLSHHHSFPRCRIRFRPAPPIPESGPAAPTRIAQAGARRCFMQPAYTRRICPSMHRRPDIHPAAHHRCECSRTRCISIFSPLRAPSRVFCSDDAGATRPACDPGYSTVHPLNLQEKKSNPCRTSKTRR